MKNTPYSETLLKGEPIMDKLKDKFKNDPVFAAGVLVVGGTLVTSLLNAVAKNVTATAYAYRASKM